MRTKQLDLKCMDGVQLLELRGRLLDTLFCVFVYMDVRQHRHSRSEGSHRPGAVQKARAEHGPSADDSRRQGSSRLRADIAKQVSTYYRLPVDCMQLENTKFSAMTHSILCCAVT